jgi:hypothetical protein
LFPASRQTRSMSENSDAPLNELKFGRGRPVSVPQRFGTIE